MIKYIYYNKVAKLSRYYLSTFDYNKIAILIPNDLSKFYYNKVAIFSADDLSNPFSSTKRFLTTPFSIIAANLVHLNPIRLPVASFTRPIALAKSALPCHIVL